MSDIYQQKLTISVVLLYGSGPVNSFSQNCIWENEVLRREVRRGGC